MRARLWEVALRRCFSAARSFDAGKAASVVVVVLAVVPLIPATLPQWIVMI